MNNEQLQTKILIVEDDEIIMSGLTYALEKDGYVVACAADVSEARTAIATSSFDLAILDMNLPDGTGFDVRKLFQESSSNTAIIFLTVVDDEGNVVRAFDEGADDYITKPFRLRELLARIKRTLLAHKAVKENNGLGSVSRGQVSANKTLRLGEVEIDTLAAKVFIGGAALELTALEYRLLLMFALNKGQVLSRSQILDGIFDAAGSYVEDNTLTVYIKRLREKLGDAANIETVRGLGYRAH